MRKLLISIGLLLLPAAALAEREVTPMLGYRGGDFAFSTGIACIQGPCPSFAESESSLAFGALVDLPLSNGFDLELLLNHQQTVLSFGENPRDIRTKLGEADLGLTHLQAGLRRTWTVGSFKPHAAFGAGLSHLDSSRLPGGDQIATNRISGSLAAGVGMRLTERVGLRVEARGYWIDLPEDFGPHMALTGDDNLVQVDAMTGLAIKF